MFVRKFGFELPMLVCSRLGIVIFLFESAHFQVLADEGRLAGDLFQMAFDFQFGLVHVIPLLNWVDEIQSCDVGLQI